MTKLHALVFDFDGIIVDTEPLHHRAFLRILEPEGISFTWEDYLADYVGFDDRDALRFAHRQADRPLDDARLRALIARKARAFNALVAEEGAVPYRGVVDLIREARGRVPLGLCSGALRSDIEPILARLDIVDVFDAVVTADDVDVSKPDPSSYVAVLQRLGQACHRDLRPASCLAVEDTPAGIAAARGAGMRVLGVTNSHPAAALGEASSVVASLAGLTLQDLQEIVAE